jgi:hypothetical protein
MHKYWGFGLKIESELEFPEFYPFEFTDADITISFGKVPATLNGNAVTHTVHISATPFEYLLEIMNVAKYYVANGKQIVIEPNPNADLASIRLFMLSNAMAAVLHQQNKIPFHASGIITEKGLVLFTGHSGAGKSTTAYGMMQKGYKLFTDDVCVLFYNEAAKKVEAFASYPMMKLWENTIEQMSIDNKRNHRLRPQLPKYGFFQHDTFSTASFPIAEVLILKSTNLQKEYSSKTLNAIEAFNELQQNSYRRKQVDMMNLREYHFKIMSQLTQHTKIRQVVRPTHLDDIDGYINYINTLVSDHA